MNLEKYNVVLKTKIRRWLSSKLRFEHPTSYPYISGDAFRAFAQHVHDEFSTCDPTRVRAGDIIFTRTYFLDEFIMHIDAHITEPYVLITHNDDYAPSIEAIEKIRAHGKAQHWFMQNAPLVDSFITPLPIGLPNYLHSSIRIIADYTEKESAQKEMPERSVIGYSFSDVGNPAERKEAREQIHVHQHNKDISRANQRDYLAQVHQCSHIVSPPGRGEDCHRTWESLHLGAIPIVKRTPLTDYFVHSGLPLFQVNTWSELVSIDTMSHYQQNLALLQRVREKTSPLWMPYWVQKIASTAETLRSSK